MNNQQSVGEQMLQLQNIAYIKQFMQKGSVKVLFVVTLLMAVANGIYIYSLKNIYKAIFDFMIKFGNSFSEFSSSDFDVSELETVMELIEVSLLATAIVTTAIALILPITLLYIIIRSRSDNPSVVPSGAVKFLYVLSFIQAVCAVVSSAISAIMQFFTIFAADEVAPAVIYFLFTIVYLFFYSFYYVLQTKFLGAIKHSCSGYSLIYGVSNGFGILSVISAIGTGLISAVLVILAVVFSSLLSSSSVETNETFETFLMMGGLELFETIKPVIVICIAIPILTTIYHVIIASISFSYKDFVTLAVRESFLLHRRPNLNNNSAFRTYGGSNSYTNYNYSASGSRGQQSYATSANSANNNQPANNTANNNRIPEAPVDSSANPYNNQPNFADNTQYTEPVANGSFISPQQQFENNNMNKEPVTTSGSFGIQQDSNNNY